VRSIATMREPAQLVPYTTEERLRVLERDRDELAYYGQIALGAFFLILIGVYLARR
jgi:hypothetical protein